MSNIISGIKNALGLAPRPILDKKYFLGKLKELSNDKTSKTYTESQRVEIRSKLIFRFGKEKKSKEVLEWLGELALNTGEKDLGYRHQAVLCLSYFYNQNRKEVETYLAQCIEDESSLIREAAINKISYLAYSLDHKQFIPALIKHLDDKDINVSLASVEALGELGGEDALKALEARYDDPRFDFSSSLNWALEKIDRHIYLEIKRDFGSGLVGGSNEDMKARNNEIINEHIKKYGKERFLSALAEIACDEDENGDYIYRAVSCLEQIGGTEALVALTSRLKSKC